MGSLRHNREYQEWTPAQPIAARPNAARRVWLRVFVSGLVLVLCAVVAYGIFLIASVAKISTNPWSLSSLQSDAQGRTSVVVLGVGDPGHAGEGLSDTILVLSLNQQLQRAAEISVPRDLRVKIAGYGTQKINAANALGGVDVARQTVGDTLGLDVPYYVRTNFNGLRSIVDVVGGLDIDVKERLYDSDYPCDSNQYLSCGLDIGPGRQHMDGARVLQYVRCRKGTCGNDFGRAARQQEVIDLLKGKLASPAIWLAPDKVRALVSAMQSYVQTNMSSWQLMKWAWGWNQATKATEPAKLVLSTSAGGMLVDIFGSSDLAPATGDFSAIQSRVLELTTR